MRTNRRTGYFDKKTKTPGDDASTAETAPSRVGRDEQGEARRANTTPNGGPHLELGRLRLKTWAKSDFSIAETTWPTYLYIYQLFNGPTLKIFEYLRETFGRRALEYLQPAIGSSRKKKNA